MSDLFGKLNTLLRARLNDLLPGSDPDAPSRAPGLGHGLDRDVAALRQKINEAMDYEERLQKQVQDLQADVARWDQQADVAVAEGREDDARYALDQMGRAQKRLTMAESDLKAHRLVAEELIRRVNQMEAAVADAKLAQQQAQAPADAPPRDASASPAAPAGDHTQDAIEGTMRRISQTFREMSDTVKQMGDQIAARQDTAAKQDAADAPAAKAQEAAAKARIDDDLSARRDRLSKK